MKREAFLLTLVASASFGQSIYRYSNPKSHITKVCVLPAEARLTRVGMKGGESLVNESEEWAGKLGTMLRNAVAAAGGESTAEPSPKSEKDNSAMRQAELQIRERYQSVSVQMRKKRRDIEKGRFTLGDEIAVLPCAAQADSVAFVDGSGILPTKSREAVGILSAPIGGLGLAMSSFQIHIGFADSRTGAITALLVIRSGGKAGKDPDEALRKVLVSQLKNLHEGVSSSWP
jgi:hypothetical protein